MQRNLAKIEHFVEMVQSWGCSVAIDDFGAGYTSFTQLKTLNVDYIKIDGAFIRDIIENPGSKLFVRTLMGFAKAHGLRTVAEFVENGEIAKVLIEMDVDYLQGYYFSKPVTHRPWIKTDKVI
jgi:EAL domain-containing protein (putative c-di-GMP-specific phosphodiesterase class I)